MTLNKVQIIVDATVEADKKINRAAKNIQKDLGKITGEMKKYDQQMQSVASISMQKYNEQTAAAAQKSVAFKDAVGGLVGTLKTTAVVATGVYASLNKAFDFGEQGAQAEALRQAFVGMGGDLDALREASRNTISDFGLMSSTNTLLIGTSGELRQELIDNAGQLLSIAKAAQTLNPALGNVDYLYKSLAVGIKRGSPLWIDNAGITLKLGEANEAYARSLGKTVEQLTAEEQKIALLRATLAGGNQIMEDAKNVNTEALDSFQRLDASVANLGNAIKTKLSPYLATAAQGLSDMITFSDQLDKMYADTTVRVYENADGYAEYREQTILAATATRQITEEQARWITSGVDARGQIALLSEEIGLLSEREYQEAKQRDHANSMWAAYAEYLNGAGTATDNLVDANEGLASSYEDITQNALGLNETLPDTISGYLEQIDLLKSGLLPVQQDVEKATQDYINRVIGADEYQRELNQSWVDSKTILGEFDGMSFDKIAASIQEELNVPLQLAEIYAQRVLEALGLINGKNVKATITISTRERGNTQIALSDGQINLDGLVAQATGGPLADSALVGEEGPEMIINGVVIPTRETRKLMALGLMPNKKMYTGGALPIPTITPTTSQVSPYSSLSSAAWASHKVYKTAPRKPTGGGSVPIGVNDNTDVSAAPVQQEVVDQGSGNTNVVAQMSQQTADAIQMSNAQVVAAIQELQSVVLTEEQARAAFIEATMLTGQ